MPNQGKISKELADNTRLHRVKFQNFNEFCCFGLFPINLGIVFIIVIGLVISAGSIALGIITKNWTLLSAYSLIAFFNFILAIGYLNIRPYFYIFYVIGNWTFAWISLFLFGIAWLLYWVDKNRWVHREDKGVWQWSGLPLEINERWAILTLSILYIVNYFLQHWSVFVIRRAYQRLLQEIELE